jgi:dCTP deaminase
MSSPSRTGILSNKEILTEIGTRLQISPFNRENLQTNSYDVTIGKYYYRRGHAGTINNRNIDMSDAGHGRLFRSQFFCIGNGEHTARYWGLKPQVDKGETRDFGANEAELITTEEDAQKYGVKVGDMIIIIYPGETILGHTNEFIGGVQNITTMMKARSSSGRSCITVCACAGLGDVGFFNRWTMEIKNHGYDPVVIVVGTRISQIVFFWCGDVLDDKSYSEKGQYQKSDNLEELEREWNPSAMLPSSSVTYMKTISDFK